MFELLSSEYGWTPKEIREQDYEDIKNYLQIISIKRKIQNININKNGRK
jgi:hypothetical protein